MNKLGIIGAMEEEVARIKEAMTERGRYSPIQIMQETVISITITI